MEILGKILLPIIIASISGIFNNWIKNVSFSSRIGNLKKLNNIINNTEKILLITNEKFNTEFILPEFKESSFYILTGISTNEKSINNYINLKNKLKENFDWKSIKKALPYLKFNIKNEVYVSISKTDILFKNIELGISFFFFLMGYGGLLISSYFINIYNINELIIMPIIFLISILFGILFLSNLSSYFIAKRIKNRLKSINETKEA